MKNLKMVKVFFSQPMNGLAIDEILKERTFMLSEFREFLIKELGFDDDIVIQDVNCMFDEKGPDNAGRLWYLGRSIQTMDNADYIVFHKDWRDANGCRVEYAAALQYFKWIIHMDVPDIKYVDEIHFGKI